MTDLVAALGRRMEEAPDSVALVSGSSRITRGELWDRARRLATDLREQGLTGGDRVALIGHNSPEWVTVWLAVMAAGGVAVPLNPELRATDLAAQVKHSGADFVYADVTPRVFESLLMALPRSTWITRSRGWATQSIVLDELNARPWRPSGTSTDLACILYTSGTTGAPKGVMLGHQGILQNAEDVAEYLGLGPNDRSLALLPFYYSFGNSVLVTHLLSGAPLIFGANLMYTEKLLDLVEAEGVTGLSGVPTLFQMLLQRDLLTDPRWSSLRYIAQAGGRLAPATVQKLRQALPGVDLYLMYGQTEATARITYLPPRFLDSKADSVGWPLPEVCVQIRDESGRTLPAGEVGQIWVRGPGVMLGYWRNPRATADVLVDGWLSTGDMGRLDEEGFLYIQGRRSDMLKVCGQRLHPQELESVICEIPQVAECAVDGVEDRVQGQVPRVFVVLKPGQQLDRQAVLRHCRAQLASWKMPRYVEIIEALPRTGSGKVQRHRLQEMAVAREGRA